MARLNIKPAASGMSHHSFDVSSILSLDFGEIMPTRVIETVKKDDFKNISAKGILRLAPQVFPTYGKAFVKSAAFFVPEYQLWEASDAFHSNMNTWKGRNVILPHFSSLDINTMLSSSNLLNSLVSTVSQPVINTVPSFDTYDFVTIKNDATGSFEYRKLTRYGQHFYKMLKLLGYEFASFSYESGMTRADIVASGAIEYNALPFLAYLKLYADFFLNPQMYNNSVLVAFLNSVQFGTDYSVSGTPYYTASTGEISATAIIDLLTSIRTPFQSSLYLDSWNSPNSPDGLNPSNTMINSNPDGLISPYIPQLNQGFDSVSSNSSNTHLTNHNGVSQGYGYITNFGLSILKSFDQFVRRRGLSGNKAVERIYSMFGIKSDFFSSHYCHKIFDAASRIDFNPVLSNSDTVNGNNGKTLGTYAGYASSGLDFSFSHKCDSFGYIICVSWIQLVPMLLHGVDPSVLRKYPFDFYTPDYDGQTVRAIPHCEVSYAKSGAAKPSIGASSTKTFGFCNLYDDYRNMKDVIAGDFVTSSNAQSFVIARDLSQLYQWNYNSVAPKPQNDYVHYLDLQILGFQPDLTEIFQMSANLGDRFYLQLDYSIEADRPIKSESDAINLNGEGELSFSMNGNSLS